MSAVLHRIRGRSKVLLGAVVALAMCLSVVGEAYAAKTTTNVTLYYDSATQASKTLKATGLNAKKATWSSSNENVVSVTNSGKAIALAAGKANITAKQGADTFKFVVTSKKVSITTAKETLNVGNTLQLGLTGDKIKNASSSSVAVATVSKTGKVTAKAVGTASITLTSKKGKPYKCKVTVNKVDVTEVAFAEPTLTLTVGDAATANPATVTPSDATYSTVTYESSDTGVATVDKKGNIKPVAAGTATITATADGESATCEVTVKVPIREVTFGATVTDAGQYVDRMIIDYGKGTVSGLTNDTFTVKMTSTVDYGASKGQPYAYYDATQPLRVVKTEAKGGKVTVYFDQSQAPTLTWLAEGRNYPAVLNFTVEQNAPFTLTSWYGHKRTIWDEYSCAATSYKDLVCDEVSAYEDVQAEVNYQLHKGTNNKLIVWFHGNGEGDFPTKDTNNNIAQILANRGGAAWVSDEAQAVFGDAYVMAFQAPNMWYFAVKDNLLEPCYNEIQQVIAEYGIDPDEVYLSGCSAGGFMSTRMVIAYPDLFKAAMINCPALDAANARSGSNDAIPTDEELAQLKNAKTAIWLVQGETDSSVDPELCSKRIWNILTDGAVVNHQDFEGKEGIASGFTTYETEDGRYKLSLYQTFDLGEVTGISGDVRQGGKIKCAEDYDQDGVFTEVKYNDHWSWIYTLRDDPQAADGTHIWEWALTAPQPVNITGTYDIHVQGYDYGAGVDQVTLTLSDPVDGLEASDLVVTEHKTATDWTASGFPVVEGDFAREVTGVTVNGTTITVDLACNPSDGSPFLYSMATGYNTWCDPYQLTIALADGAKVTSDGLPVASFSVSGDPVEKTTSADAWNIGSYTTTTATNNVTYNYASWDPEQASDTLVVWLHGAGEGGTEALGTDPYVTILANKVVALSSDEFQAKVGGAHVVAPQCPTMWMDIDGNGTYISTQNSTEVNSYYTESLEEFIDAYAAQVGATKVVLAGCSNGGFMTLWMGLHRPDRYAAIVPICEAVPDALISDAQIEGIKNLPMYFIWSEDDTTVTPSVCEEPTVARLLAAGATNLHVSTTEHVVDTSRAYDDADGNQYVYNGHWSWIYFDNDECVCNGGFDNCGLGAWDFIGLAVQPVVPLN